MKGEIVKYSPETALAVLERLADGMTVAGISRLPGMPSVSGMRTWRIQYPEFARAWKTAKELSAESFEDKALDIADDLVETNDYTGTKVRALEVAISQYRWSAARRDPKNYGQQADAKIVVPIQINTSLDLNNDAMGGLSTPEHENVYAIKAEVQVPVAEDDDEPGGRTSEAEDDARSPFSLPDNPTKLIETAKKVGRPTIASKRHKTEGRVRATIANRSRRKKVHPRVKEILGLKEDT